MPIGADFYQDEDPLGNRDANVSEEFSLPGEMAHIEDMEDGSSVFDIKQEIIPYQQENKFNENLAEIIPEAVLNKIASQLLEDIENDIESRREWEASYNLGLKFLGIKVEEFRDYPFAHASSVYDSTLISALLRFYSTARAELFPPGGPAQSQILGPDTDEIQHLAKETITFLNHYLTIMDREYYPDCDRMLWYLGLVGSIVKKVYRDPVSGKPKSRYIDPQDFIINAHCKTILGATRKTHRIFLTKKDIKLRQNKGYYSESDIPKIQDDYDTEEVTTANVNRIVGINTTQSENKSLFQAFESDVEMEMGEMGWKDPFSPDKDLPLPYKITIVKQTRKIASIYRNWKENDEEYREKPVYVLYNYLPGFGVYGIGLAQLIGSSAIGATSLTRQLIDAGMLKNFPGGLKMKGFRVENNDKAIGPSEFWDIDTGGLPIQQAVMMMPYNEPSVVLRELRNDLIQQMQTVANTAETQIADMSKEMPVGTTLAMLEVTNRVQSTILRTCHMSLSYELDLIYQLFKEEIEDTPFQFDHPEGQTTITKQHFDDFIRIVPTSDPNLTSSTQRILRAEAILRLAQSAPEIHDMKNAYRRMYMAMNVDDIEKLLPPEEEVQALDPITENMNALNAKPVKAGIEQDHDAHIAVHQLLDTETLPNMAAHIQEHLAFKFLIDIQQKMGMQLPPPEAMQDPKIQNEVAMMAAQAAKQLKEEKDAAEPHPDDIMKMDIEQRREAAMLKHKEAELVAETRAFEITTKQQENLKKMQEQLEIAEERNRAQLEIAELRNQHAKLMAEEKNQVQLEIAEERNAHDLLVAAQRNELEREMAEAKNELEAYKALLASQKQKEEKKPKTE